MYALIFRYLLPLLENKMTLFTRLPVVYTGSESLPTVSVADVTYLSEYEENAAEHWVFDKGNSSNLVGVVNGLLLTAQSDAPTHSSNFLSISTAVGKALLSTISEQTDGKITVWAVSKLTTVTGNPQPVFGNFNNSGGGFMDSNTLNGSTVDKKAYLRGTTNANPLTIANTANNIWTFSAISMDMSSVNKLLKSLVTPTDYNEITLTGTYVIGGTNIGIGNSYYSSAATATLSVAEFGIINSAYTIPELVILYNRAKARMALRGISVL